MIYEQWKVNNRFHRIGGPAEVAIDPKTGVVTLECWYEHSEYHRDGDLPANTMRDAKTGHAVLEGWYQRGRMHRDHDQPACISRRESGILIKLEYHWHGQLHRLGRPAVITFDRTGTRVRSAQYYVNGVPVNAPTGSEPQPP